MAIGLEVLASNIAGFLSTIAPVIAIILIILGGILYGVAQTQPPDTRGKWQTAAISMIIGGIIVGAITAAAAGIESVSETLLKNG
ncbi:MAG: hypothetical protein PHV13_03085 [Candidatus ainarchaeum sp.]|nr:hypothetical protein [Candidatus ainarchaeum sp.]